MITPEQLAELRQLEKDITRGRWYACSTPEADHSARWFVRAEHKTDTTFEDNGVCESWGGSGLKISDVQFIAAVRNALPALLEAAARGLAVDHKIKRISDHCQYIRFVEKRYKEVGKEKYDFAKLNGPLSAIEREIAAYDAACAKGD